MRLPRGFIARWQVAFETSRRRNRAMVTAFVASIEHARPAPSDQPEGGQSPLGSGWRSTPDSHMSLWQTLGQALKERHYLRKVWAAAPQGSTWIVADDRRTGFLDGWKSFGEQVKVFGGGAPPAMLGQGSAPAPVFFSPNLLALRGEAQCPAAIHLGYLSLFAVPLAFPFAFLRALAAVAAAQPLAGWARRITWVTTLLAAAIRTLLWRQQPDRLLMITSNSYVIELLRYLYAVSGVGAGVIEVLHGVPTCELDAYHAEMLEAAPQWLTGRQTMVAPVPGMGRGTYPDGIAMAAQAVNLKMNGVMRSTDMAALERRCAERSRDRQGFWVVAVNGAGTVEGKPYIETGCFAIEQAILRHLLKEAGARGLRLHCQYSLHPAHIKSGAAPAIRAALEGLDVEVLEDSLLTWLESDLCISIFSSASWDAHALGCRVAICVRDEDELYSAALLAPFAHPKGSESILEVLSRELGAMAGWARTGADQRLRRLCGGC